MLWRDLDWLPSIVCLGDINNGPHSVLVDRINAGCIVAHGILGLLRFNCLPMCGRGKRIGPERKPEHG